MLTLPLCICKNIQPITTAINFHFVVHKTEWNKGTNTARLALLSLTNSSKNIFGAAGGFDWSNLEKKHPEDDLYILFPTYSISEGKEGKEGIDDFQKKFNKLREGRTTIIVPDGNWGQAKDIARKIFIRTKYPFLSLPFILPSCYRLRTSPKKSYLSTFEAVISLIRILEGEDRALLLYQYFNLFVEKNLFQRGLS